MDLDNDPAISTDANPDKPEEEEIDPIWLSSRTARQIYGLCQVEKVSIVPTKWRTKKLYP